MSSSLAQRAVLWLDPPRIRRIAVTWCVIALVSLTVHLMLQRQVGLTNGAGRPFGEDFLNFWSAAHLTVIGRTSDIYDLALFHEFQRAVVAGPLDLYHYSYPPVMLLLSAPLGLVSYQLGWAIWQLGGWFAYALALRRISQSSWVLISLSLPAVFINALGGQIGCWIAAILGWGLIWLPRKPVLAGIILALLVVKPQLAWLVPIALLAGRQYCAAAAMCVTAVLLIGLSAIVFGIDIWFAYAGHAAMLKTVILENGSGTWHRMISVFVLVRHLGASLSVAYTAQVIVSVPIAVLIIVQWRSRGPSNSSFAMLLVAVLAGSVYASDYDCVLLGLAVAWAWPMVRPENLWRIIAAILTPLVAAPVAVTSGVAVGAAMLWPMLLWLRQQGTESPSKTAQGESPGAMVAA